MLKLAERKYNTPYTAKEKEKALKLLARTDDLIFVSHRYHCTVRTLYRWKRQYDGTVESLGNKSSRPHTKHPNAHTDEEIDLILRYVRRNPEIGLNELYGKLCLQGYRRNFVSLYRLLKKMGYYKGKSKRQNYKPKPYQTPVAIGIKWQMDVKYVPNECNIDRDPFATRYYQYTVIDEASRERYIRAYREQSSFSTIDFILKAFRHFGYLPQIIQTDNGSEFTHLAKTDRIHPLDKLCKYYGIKHQLIKPRTPRHNGKVERSHRNDNERFYKTLRFYNFEDLQKQMTKYLYRSNRIPSRVLTDPETNEHWRTPIQMREALMKTATLRKF